MTARLVNCMNILEPHFGHFLEFIMYYCKRGMFCWESFVFSQIGRQSCKFHVGYKYKHLSVTKVSTIP